MIVTSIPVGVLMILAAMVWGRDASANPSDGRVLADFDGGAAPGWYSLNDDVMGGRSRGAFEVRDGVLLFTGATNTDGGGFASIRSGTQAMTLAGFTGIRLRLRGDGRRYTFRLTTTTVRYRGSPLPYRADFETHDGTGWQVVDVPFAAFLPRWRGRSVQAPPLDPGRIDSLGIQIYDKRDGPFKLEVDWIQAYRERPPFSMQRYRWGRRPLLVFAPRADDARLVRQRADVAATRRDFEERDMALVVVLTDGVSEADGRALTESEARGLRERYDVPAGQFKVKLVGKDGGVKRSESDAVAMRSIYGLIDTMPMRQREMRR